MHSGIGEGGDSIGFLLGGELNSFVISSLNPLVYLPIVSCLKLRQFFFANFGNLRVTKEISYYANILRVTKIFEFFEFFCWQTSFQYIFAYSFCSIVV